jgi:hypothetical protein
MVRYAVAHGLGVLCVVLSAALDLTLVVIFPLLVATFRKRGLLVTRHHKNDDAGQSQAVPQEPARTVWTRRSCVHLISCFCTCRIKTLTGSGPVVMPRFPTDTTAPVSVIWATFWPTLRWFDLASDIIWVHDACSTSALRPGKGCQLIIPKLYLSIRTANDPLAYIFIFCAQLCVQNQS